MICTTTFRQQYPTIRIKENFGIQDQFTMRIEMMVPDNTETDEQQLVSDACYALGYFGGYLLGKDKVEGGMRYHINGWKD